MTSLAGEPAAIASADASIWNRNGTGSSSWWKEARKREKEGEGWKTSSYGETHLWSELVYESFQGIFRDISGQIDGRC